MLSSIVQVATVRQNSNNSRFFGIKKLYQRICDAEKEVENV